MSSWKLTSFPKLQRGPIIIEAEQIFLGWKHVLAYNDTKLTDLITGRIYRDGPVDQCSLSRDWCGILHRGECQVIGLYDDSVIDVHISDNQQISMLELDRLALRTHNEVLIFDLKKKSIVEQWPLSCTQISAGFDHLLALTSEGKVFCWGDASRGQQGSDNIEKFSKTLLPVEALEELTISKVSAGGWHCSALSVHGLIYQWGWNEQGQLGGTPLRSGHHIRNDNANHNKTASIIIQPSLKQLDRSPIIVDIACGSRHSVALDNVGVFWSWGWNDYGQCDLNQLNSVTVGIDEQQSKTHNMITEKILQPFKVDAAFWTTCANYTTI